jgi:hypothetical protein
LWGSGSPYEGASESNPGGSGGGFPPSKEDLLS